jgi:methyltransferase (TIGR00027 family)
MSRAASSLEPDARLRSDDRLALLLVPTFLRLLLHIPLARRFVCRVLAPTGIYAYTIARTKYIDAAFQQALAQGFDQVLIFGAGFDTRALRFQALALNTRIFELDMAPTQQAKLGQYARRGLRVPANLTFIPIDFNTESLSEKLHAAGFANGARTLFVLEGVLMYLQPESVDATFQVIQAFAGQGSAVVFDYVRQSALSRTKAHYGASRITATVAKAGEAWQFGIAREALEPFLASYGLHLTDYKDARALELAYFTDATGTLLARVNATHCLVQAVKTGKQSEALQDAIRASAVGQERWLVNRDELRAATPQPKRD